MLPRLCIPSGANASLLLAEYHNSTSEETPVGAAMADMAAANISIISSAEQYFRVGVLKVGAGQQGEEI